MGLEIINKLKKEKGLTTAELSKLSGVPLGTLNKILQGTTKDPKLETLKSIARVLECNLSDFDSPSDNVNRMNDKICKNAIPIGSVYSIPILGTIRAGYGSTAVESILGYELTDYPDDKSCFFLKVKGNSMEPKIYEGDLALIDREVSVENGDIAAVIIDGDDGTIKKFCVKDNAIAAAQSKL